MDLLDLRTEVQAHGFSSTVYTNTRINQFLNDAQSLVARRVNYYVEEATNPFPTVSGTASYAFPADMGRMRSLFDTSRNIEMESVDLRMIDRSSQVKGAPAYYALDGANVHLYPTPDGVYSLEMRYWKLPAKLVLDADTPSLPPDYHRLLWLWAVKECYASDDDPQTAQYWEQQFNTLLAEFAADQKFPDTDRPYVAAGMWESERALRPPGWSLSPWAG